MSIKKQEKHSLDLDHRSFPTLRKHFSYKRDFILALSVHSFSIDVQKIATNSAALAAIYSASVNSVLVCCVPFFCSDLRRLGRSQ